MHEDGSALTAPTPRRRRWARVALAGAAISALGLLVAHAPPVRGWALGRLTASLHEAFGVDLGASALHYNLLTLTARLDDVTMASTSTPDQPFARAGQISVVLGPATLLGRVDVRRVDLESPVIAVAQTTEGGNLPDLADGGSGADAVENAPAFPHVVANDLDVSFARNGTRTELHDVSLEVLPGPTAGSFEASVAAAGGGRVTTDSATWQISGLSTDLAYDGVVVTVHAASVERDATTLRGSGQVDLSGDTAALNLDVSGTTDLASWNAEGADDLLVGMADFTARVGGTLSSPILDIDARGRGVAWDVYRTTTIDARGSWRDGRLVVDRLEGDLGGGRLVADGVFPLTEPATESRVSATWSSVDVRRVLMGDDAVTAPVNTTGTGTFTWRSPRPDADIQMTLAATTDVSAGPYEAPMRLGIDGVATGTSWRFDVATIEPDPLQASVDASLSMDAASWRDYVLSADVSLVASDLSALRGRLRAAGVPAATLDALPGAGSATVTARMRGTLGAPRVDGRATGQALTIPGAPSVDLTTTFDADVANDTSTGTFELRASALEDWSAREFPEAGFSGSVRAAGTWSGTLAAPVAVIALDGSDLGAYGLNLGVLTSSLRVSTSGVDLESIRLVQPSGGVVDVSGAYEWTTGAFTARARATRWLLTWPVENAGTATTLEQLSFEGSVRGTTGDLRGAGRFDVAHATVRGLDWGAVGGDVGVSGSALSIAAAIPELATRVVINTSLDSPAFDGSANVDDAPINRLLALAGLGTSGAPYPGTLSATARFAGALDALEAIEATIEMAPAGTTVDGLALAMEAPLSVTVAGGRARWSGAELRLAGITLRSDGDISLVGGDGSASLDISGDPTSIEAWLFETGVNEPRSWAGQMAGRLEARHSSSGLSVNGALTASATDVSGTDETALGEVGLALDFDGTRAVVRRLTAVGAGTDVSATGAIPLRWADTWLPDALQFGPAGDGDQAALALDATLDIAEFVRDSSDDEPGSDGLGGTLELQAEFTAREPTLAALTGDAVFRAARITSTDGVLAQDEPTRLRLSEGRLAIEAFRWSAGDDIITASGSIGLVPGVSSDASAAIDTDLRLLRGVLPGRAAGRLTARASFVGDGQASNLTADARLAGASWLLPDARLLFDDWSGAITYDRGALALEAFGGALNGGRVDLAGAIDLATGAPEGRLTIAARNILLDVPDGLYSQLGADLAWEVTDDAPTLGGMVTVTANRYSEPITRVLELVDAVAPDRAGTAPLDLPALVANTRLAVQIEVTDPIVVDNSLGSLELVPDLVLTGTLAAPALDGAVTALDDGRIRLGGRAYRLRESALRFAPADGLMPTFDALGETQIGDYDVQLRITGAASQLEMSYMSSPPLSERDLRALVLTGRTESAGDEDNEAFAIAAAATDILGFAGKFVGLDSVRLGAADLDLVNTDVGQAQHLTVSKSFGRVLELIFSDNLEDGAVSWVVSWKPVQTYEVRLASIENEDLTLEFRQELLFGPGARTATAPAASSRLERRVTAVTFEGEPGFGESDLLGQLRNRPGRRFDARQWTDDRLRLERFYHQRGFRRARIAPGREFIDDGPDAPGVRLSYDIQRGPRTEITIAGDGLPGSAVDAMYTAWRGIPIEDLLREELIAIARAHLARQQYFQPAIDVAFPVDSATQAEAVVTVDRGPKTRTPVITFRGNRVIADDVLQTAAAGYTGESSPWLDPAVLAADIGRRYAALGYLTAAVEVAPPVFDGTTATLSVTIEEGPASTIRAVTLTGVDTARQAPALDAVALPPGTPLGPATAVDAHRRLEQFYAGLGFRDAAVAYAVVPHDDATATVTFDVTEGPLSVIDAVSIAGVDSTSRDLVAPAIALEPGEPATPDAANTTRRNLYDIGSFRRVDVSFEPDGRDDGTGRQLVRALVTAEEPRRFQLRYGLQLLSDYSVTRGGRASLSYGGTVELRDRNFLGRAMQASAGFTYQPDLQVLSLLLAAPRTFGRNVRTNIYARERREIDEHDDVGITLGLQQRDITLEQRWHPHQDVELAWGYEFGFRRYTLKVPPVLDVSFDGYLAGPTASVVIDRRNAPLDATRGWLHSSSLQLGVEPLGSDLGFVRYLARQTGYVPLGPVTLAGSGRWGTLNDFSGTAPLSILELTFQAGGSSSVRGYPHDALSAVYLDTVPLGGAALLIFNGEVRFPIHGWVNGVVFADAGNTFATLGDMALDALATSAGLGLRVNTPFAALRLDIGRPLTDRFGARRWRFHFSLGQMF